MKFSIAFLLASTPATSGYAFVASSSRSSLSNTNAIARTPKSSPSSSSSSSLKMIDQQVLMGAGIALAGLTAGIGMVSFTEVQGERAKSRGSGLSDSMATQITGGLMEDVEVSTVADLGSLTSQLENALKQSGGVDDKKMKDMELTDEEKQKIKEDQDDGW